MKLVLNLLGPPRLMGARQVCELRAGSLSVGRSPEADWVIPDTSRLISRLHLRIDASHGDFVLTDTSANGVTVNESPEPVGYGASVKLRHGDRLRVGEAQIGVTIEEGRRDEPASSFRLNADAFSAQIAPHAAPFPGRRDPLGGPFNLSLPAGAAAAAAPAGPARAVIDANWMNEPVAQAPGSTAEPRPAVLPLRPGDPIAGGVPGAQAGPGAPPSVLALVEASAGLSVRSLASAIDAARPAIDPRAWKDFHERVRNFVHDTGV